MATSFERTVGPKADMHELEYISALHQTGAKGTRPTGTISSLDIMRFLKSRHSIDISHGQARDIVRGLGGAGGAEASTDLKMSIARKLAERIRTDREREEAERQSHHLRWSLHLSSSYKSDDNSQSLHKRSKKGQDDERSQMLVEESLDPTILYLDLVQMTSVILMPTLARMAKQWRDENMADNEKDKEDNDTSSASDLDPPEGLLELVHDNMCGVLRAAQVQAEYACNEEAGDDVEINIRTYTDHGSLPPRISPELVQTLLQENGEVQRASDPVLVQQMVDMAHSKSGRFDMEALVNALTSDLEDWVVGCEDKESSYLVDILGDSDKNDGWLTGATTLEWDVKASAQQVHKNNNKPKSNGIANSAKARQNTTKSTRSHKSNNSVDVDASFLMRIDESNGGIVEDASSSEDDNILFNGIQEEFPTPPPETNDDKKLETEAQAELEASAPVEREKRRLEIKGSAKIIDAVVDAYASTTTMALIWITYIAYSASYASLLLSTDPFTYDCKGRGSFSDDQLRGTFGILKPLRPSFSCTLGKTVLTWLTVALLLVGFGMTVLGPLAYGNHPTKRGPMRMLVATAVALGITLIPFFVVREVGESGKILYSGVQAQVDDPTYKSLVYFTTFLGCGLSTKYFFHFLFAVGRNLKVIGKQNHIIEYFSETSYTKRTATIKRAATRKINGILTNATEMHGRSIFEEMLLDHGNSTKSRSSSKSSLARSQRKAQSDLLFENFTLRGERKVQAGSLLWSWEHIIDGGLFELEGIFLPSRMLIFQLGQVVIGGYFVVVLFEIVEIAADAADAATAELEDHRFRGLFYPDWVIDFIPTGDEVRLALMPAAVVAILVCVALTLIYVPSAIKTVLKFRCGQLPSLGSKSFNQSRAGADKIHMNIANAIYAMVAGAFLFFVLIGLALFLFLWEFSHDFMILILAWGIGLTITMLVKSVMVSFCRKRLYRAFYRTLPGRANTVTLALECWFIGLGGGVLIGRLTQFLLASAFWIGRIDEPFLAGNVNLLGYKFDYVPMNFITELLVHEAHKHPFIERLGSMYLMRLRYKTFGSDAGACWRQLFVNMLMPWLMKHRVFHEQRAMESATDQESEKEIEKDEDMRIKDIAKDLLWNGTQQVTTVGQELGQVGLDTVGVGAKAVGNVANQVTNVGRAGFDTVEGGAKAAGNVGMSAVGHIIAVGQTGADIVMLEGGEVYV